MDIKVYMQQQQNNVVETFEGMDEAVVIPTVTCGSGTSVMNVHDPSCAEAVETRCLRSMCGIVKHDRVRNERITESVGSISRDCLDAYFRTVLEL